MQKKHVETAENPQETSFLVESRKLFPSGVAEEEMEELKRQLADALESRSTAILQHFKDWRKPKVGRFFLG